LFKELRKKDILLLTGLDFPLWLWALHYLNIVFLSLIIRSGIEILSAHPKLYLNDDANERLSLSLITTLSVKVRVAGVKIIKTTVKKPGFKFIYKGKSI
jgi:hypothetical protein